LSLDWVLVLFLLLVHYHVIFGSFSVWVSLSLLTYHMSHSFSLFTINIVTYWGLNLSSYPLLLLVLPDAFPFVLPSCFSMVKFFF
jgi:hypothetical protein